MNPVSVAQVLARANATMVQPHHDVTGALARLLSGAALALPADAVAVLVESQGTLEVLAATSHRVADLEVHQAQVEQGPCLDAIVLGEATGAGTEEEMVRRWPNAGQVIVEAGYRAVLATPLVWHGSVFGGLNVFTVEPTDLAGLADDCRALADAVTLVIVSGHLTADHLVETLEAALSDRAVVEQAKGALAHVLGVEVPEAYDALVEIAEAEGTTLGVAARRVMDRARAGTLGDRSQAP